jgi:hypothetical protein
MSVRRVRVSPGMERLYMTALRIALIVLFAMVTAGCEAIGNIFQAGIWVGAIMVVLVLAIVGFIASRFRRRS